MTAEQYPASSSFPWSSPHSNGKPADHSHVPCLHRRTTSSSKRLIAVPPVSTHPCRVHPADRPCVAIILLLGSRVESVSFWQNVKRRSAGGQSFKNASHVETKGS